VILLRERESVGEGGGERRGGGGDTYIAMISVYQFFRKIETGGTIPYFTWTLPMYNSWFTISYTIPHA
jgi:hypothetical protein